MRKIFNLLLFCCCVALLLAACSSQYDTGGTVQIQQPISPLSCIAVLPAIASVGKDETVVYAEAQSLESGAAYATEVIEDELKGKSGLRFLSARQVSSLVPEYSVGTAGTVTAIWQKLHCDGVLLTAVHQFHQREGTEYAVDSPAAVKFQMELHETRSGNILWTADFREEQESFLGNILTFNKVRKRGFKWVDAEQLMAQGIKERLASCPYLQ